MQNDQMKRIWTEWKNVILVTLAVVITISAMWWLPPIVGLFEPDQSKIKTTAEQVMNMMWWVVFFLAAQSMFANRKKRKAAQQAEEGSATAVEAASAPIDDDANPRS